MMSCHVSYAICAMSYNAMGAGGSIDGRAEVVHDGGLHICVMSSI